MGKRLKLDDGQEKPNAYQVTEDDIELMTELERESSVGRFMLEKRSKFNIQGGSKIVSCCITQSTE